MAIDFEAEVEMPEGIEARLVQLAGDVLLGEGLPSEATLVILVTDEAALRELNRDFRDDDHGTDVLSFPGATEGLPPGTPPHAGDIAISLDVAQRQADELGHALEAELDHLLVHGILHLCGYEHVNGGEEEAVMRAREEHYLGDLSGFHAEPAAS